LVHCEEIRNNGKTKDHLPRGLPWLVVNLESHAWVNDGSTTNFWHDDDTTGKISPVWKRDYHEAVPLMKITIPSHDKLPESITRPSHNGIQPYRMLGALWPD
jgi:hypothetical protein